MACKCLNVRIHPQPQSETPPDFLMKAIGDSEYALTYVGEQGITIAHPQVTMRTKKVGQPFAGTGRCIRFTTLTCLICQTLAYRVRQLVPLDVDGQEGPMLPSPDWVEQEALLSSCGWIEVHKNCLVAEDVTRLSSSSMYSTTFGVAVPQSSVQPPTTPVQSAQETSQNSLPQTGPSVGPLLSNLKPLFPPAPFVPCHLVFSHLSALAVKQSESLRSSADEHLAAIVRDKIAELERAEDKLRMEVEELWRNFVENVGEVEKDIGGRLGETRRRDSSRGFTLNTSGVPGTPLVSVRTFVPVASTAPRVTSPASSVPKLSSLSASLATSAFYHPRAVQEQAPVHPRSSSDSPQSPPPYSSQPSSLGSVDSPLSSSSEPLPALSPRIKADNTIQPFRRSMDESRDTTVSFRYFTILEADVARARHHVQDASQSTTGSEEATCQPGESAKERGGFKATRVTSGPEVQANQGGNAKEDQLKKTDKDIRPAAEGTPRNRRKVKFDIKADSTDGLSAEKHSNDLSTRRARASETEEMIFDWDDGSSEPESSDAAPALPLIENAQIPSSRKRLRISNNAGLPASLSSLRPNSLPAYSTLQSKFIEGAVPDNGVSHPTSPNTPSEQARMADPEQFDPQEDEILKLVAANTPSHRGAWKRNSKAWQTFVSRSRNGVAGTLIPEEVEDGSGQTAGGTDGSDWNVTRDSRWPHGPPGFPASLPVNIGPLSRRREPLSLASYQPKTPLSERVGILDSRRHTSSTLRKASYAERDRSRAMDPGALDFAAGDGGDEEEDESDEEPSKPDLDEARGRQRALKILEARSKIPEAGMWMSLA
ncbi:hypothetical protein PAXRUDRAFT_826294 [Paxillus rubicundulus Ve08.2h10]|uniref:Unplaced genomic scaffold scaffold_180, whole genome shotgun sequence n=1 Tax=Paxillus rubicundulus Ve08.2h10 TaxID=930991 RepID=A0A0D0DZQ2_9AGAM|nr:hypothetical protein PAXRUDRAFT_826294 [Paxillus rubicundulus Ve08.2h10]